MHHERIAALTILGMCNWVAWWYQADRGGPAVADTIADSAVAVLCLLISTGLGAERL